VTINDNKMQVTSRNGSNVEDSSSNALKNPLGNTYLAGNVFLDHVDTNNENNFPNGNNIENYSSNALKKKGSNLNRVELKISDHGHENFQFKNLVETSRPSSLNEASNGKGKPPLARKVTAVQECKHEENIDKKYFKNKSKVINPLLNINKIKPKRYFGKSNTAPTPIQQQADCKSASPTLKSPEEARNVSKISESFGSKFVASGSPASRILNASTPPLPPHKPLVVPASASYQSPSKTRAPMSAISPSQRIQIFLARERRRSILTTASSQDGNRSFSVGPGSRFSSSKSCIATPSKYGFGVSHSFDETNLRDGFLSTTPTLSMRSLADDLEGSDGSDSEEEEGGEEGTAPLSSKNMRQSMLKTSAPTTELQTATVESPRSLSLPSVNHLGVPQSPTTIHVRPRMFTAMPLRPQSLPRVTIPVTLSPICSVTLPPTRQVTLTPTRPVTLTPTRPTRIPIQAPPVAVTVYDSALAGKPKIGTPSNTPDTLVSDGKRFNATFDMELRTPAPSKNTPSSSPTSALRRSSFNSDESVGGSYPSLATRLPLDTSTISRRQISFHSDSIVGKGLDTKYITSDSDSYGDGDDDRPDLFNQNNMRSISGLINDLRRQRQWDTGHHVTLELDSAVGGVLDTDHRDSGIDGYGDSDACGRPEKSMRNISGLIDDFRRKRHRSIIAKIGSVIDLMNEATVGASPPVTFPVAQARVLAAAVPAPAPVAAPVLAPNVYIPPLNKNRGVLANTLVFQDDNSENDSTVDASLMSDIGNFIDILNKQKIVQEAVEKNSNAASTFAAPQPENGEDGTAKGNDEGRVDPASISFIASSSEEGWRDFYKNKINLFYPRTLLGVLDGVDDVRISTIN